VSYEIQIHNQAPVYYSDSRSFGQFVRSSNPDFQIWELKSLKKIGGHKVQVFGNPQVVKTDIGKAIKFDGVDDRILVDNNPIGAAKEFTIEVIFKADPAYEISSQPASSISRIRMTALKKESWWSSG